MGAPIALHDHEREDTAAFLAANVVENIRVENIEVVDMHMLAKRAARHMRQDGAVIFDLCVESLITHGGYLIEERFERRQYSMHDSSDVTPSTP